MKIEPRLGSDLDNTATDLGLVAALPPGVVRPELMFPSWPAPRWVRAVCTTRRGGVGEPPFDKQNLAAHVGDDAGAVRDNRATLKLALKLKHDPLWLEQVHGGGICTASDEESFFSHRRDGRTGRMAALIWMDPQVEQVDQA